MQIPGIGVDLPVRQALIRGRTWDFSQFSYEAGHLERTAYPGQGSNIVIGAHYELADFSPGPFYRLDQVETGDPIAITFQGRVYAYEVTETSVIALSDIGVVLPTPYELLTLIMCYRYQPTTATYTQRYVVRAVPVVPP